MTTTRLPRLLAVAALTGCLVVFVVVTLSDANAFQAGGLTDASSMTSVADPSAVPNIILIIVDTLRPDHVSAYGYGRETTPNLDALIAAQGALFKDVTVASSWTYPSNAALFSGHNPSSIGVDWSMPGSSIPAVETLLAEYLHDAGYYTAAFVTAHYARARFGFDQGFDHFEEHIGSGGNWNATRASEINGTIKHWLDENWTPVLSGTQPLFLYLYYYDPHTWYDPPSPYDTLYDPTYTGTLTADVYRDGQDVVSGAIVPTARDVEHLLALYDGEITYWDFYFGEMMDYLESVHLLDNSIVVVTSDHGEMFGEHGKWNHRNSVYEEVLRVPLLIRYNDVISAGLVISTPVHTLDVTPSVVDWVGLPVPENLHGISLKGLVAGEPITQPRDIFSEIDAVIDPTLPGYWLAPRHEMRAIRRGDWKYIHTLGLINADELYELEPSSIFETDNVLDAEPEIAATLFQALVDWFGIPTEYLFSPVILK